MPIDVRTISLRPEERLISAVIVDSPEPKKPLTAIEALQRLAGATKPEDIGKAGPLKAAAAFPENRNTQALRTYEFVCGRDSLVSALLVFDQFPALASATVKHLAELQGVRRDEMSEEEPGKIIHEARPPDDPIADEIFRKWGWRFPYYGSIDATPLFIIAAARCLTVGNKLFLQQTFTGRDGQSHTIQKAVQAALGWVTRKLDQSPDTILESSRLNTKGGLIAQSWRDSPDAHHHADGSLVDFNASLSSISTQALAYDALRDAASLFPTSADELNRRAAKLRETVLEKFWLEDDRGGYFALGSERDADGHLNLLRIRTSSMGHLLHSRILDGNDSSLKRIRTELVKTLFSPELLSHSGIRTLASHENRYRPYSYHNGSVWPWDNYWISLGLLRHGHVQPARDLRQRILAITQATKRFPEMVCGADDLPLLSNRLIKVRDTKYNFDNVIEQPPQEIQAWTVASVVAIQNLEKQYGRLSE